MKRGGFLPRKTPLKARTPLKSTARLVTRTPLRQVSDKQKNINKRRAKLLREMRREQDWCTRCGVRGQHLDGHELVRRSQYRDGPADASVVVLICRLCHSWVTENPRASHDEGWTVWGWEHRRRDQ